MTGVNLRAESVPSPSDVMAGSMPRVFQKNPPTETAPIDSIENTDGILPRSDSIIILSPDVAEPEEEGNFSFDIYMSVGST